MATIINKITIHRGNPYTGNIQLLQADGTAYDLTGCTVLFTVKDIDDFSDTDSLAQITQDITVHYSPTEGKTTIELTPEQTKIDVGFYKWDIRIYKAEDSSTELVQRNSYTASCEVVDIVSKRIPL